MALCTYCGSSWNETKDHVKPKISGGVTTVPACGACNSSKGKKSLLEWFRWLKSNDRYRWKRIEKNHYCKKSQISRIVHSVRDEN